MSSFVSVISLSEIFNQGSYWLFKYNLILFITTIITKKYLFYIFLVGQWNNVLKK